MREVKSGSDSRKGVDGLGILDRRPVRTSKWKRLRAVACIVCVSALSATCEKDPTDPIVEPPAVGSIQVSLTATGATPEPNGCRVSIDDGQPYSIDYGGSVMFTDLDVGSHVVALSSIPTNCATTNENPHSVTVNQNQTTHTGFSVACEGDQAQQLKPYLAVDKIAVGVPLDDFATVKVTAEDAEGQDDDWSVESSDPGIVEAVEVPPDQITLTGVATGQADVTVTSASGLSSTVQVVVYEPMVLAVNDGELLIKYAYTFQHRASTGWPGLFHLGLTDFFHPVTDTAQGWYALGSLGVGPYHNSSRHYFASGNANNRQWMIVVKDNSGTALAPPDSFRLEYNWSVFVALYPFNGSFWTPVCPAGYVALGTVVTTNGDGIPGYNYTAVVPSTDDVRCVREGLTALGQPLVGGYDFYLDDVTLANTDSLMNPGSKLALADDEYANHILYERHRYGEGSFRAWRTIPRDWDDPLDANAYLETGTFVAIGDGNNDGGSTNCGDGAPDTLYVPPDGYRPENPMLLQPPTGSCYDPQVVVDNRMARVLAVKLPMLLDRKDEALPSLRNAGTPVHLTEPTVGKAMRLPFTMLLRGYGGHATGIYQQREDYLLESPFMVLEQVQQYRLFEDWFRVNTGAAYSDDNISYTTGTTTTKTTSMSHTAGVSLSVETGLSFLGSGTKVTASLSYEFEYETAESREVFQSREVSFSFHCPAYHACACWSGFTRLIVSKLMPGGGLRNVAELDYRSGYRYTATYPFEQP